MASMRVLHLVATPPEPPPTTGRVTRSRLRTAAARGEEGPDQAPGPTPTASAAPTPARRRQSLRFAPPPAPGSDSEEDERQAPRTTPARRSLRR